MNNLTPVVRPDVNGKMVTRHVKSLQSPALSSREIPPVPGRSIVAESGGTIKAAQGRRYLVKALGQVISPNEVQYQRHANSEMKELIRELPDSTAEEFRDVFGTLKLNGEKVALASLVIKALDCGTDPVDIESAIYYFGESSTTEREMIDEYFEVGSSKLASYPIGNLLDAVKSYDLEGFHFNPERPLGKQYAQTQAQCIALKELHYVAEGLEHSYTNPSKPFADDGTLKDPRLAQMVVSNPDIINDVIEVVYDRQTVDYDLIASILGNEASAMREGTL